jgi:general stress protein CsbA
MHLIIPKLSFSLSYKHMGFIHFVSVAFILYSHQFFRSSSTKEHTFVIFIIVVLVFYIVIGTIIMKMNNEKKKPKSKSKYGKLKPNLNH